ncbi:hypothetical protein [Streptomyces sp. URMC 123]|uniref:hypothetical protein n=1 Tax=Streptomyces sp. URMC 123 TaxID=3423403 RepID=UPI003F193BE6
MDISATGLRTLRAAVFAALCVTLSACSHVLLSGMPLPLTTVAALAGAVFLVAYAGAGRERGLGSIAALLIPLELAADTVFTTGQHACYGHAGGPVTGPLRSFGVHLVCGGGSVGTPLARMAAPGADGAAPGAAGTALPWLLLIVHTAVGLAAAWWLRRGEAALGRLVRAAAAATFRPLLLAVAAVVAVADPARRPTGPVRRAPLVRAQPMLAHSVGRRGPPRSLALAGV